MKTERQKRQFAQQLFKKVQQKKRQCFEEGCSSKTINSHILQKNGIISQIMENGKVMSLEGDLFSSDRIPIVFKERGGNETFMFPGFCNIHDTNIFKEIEQEEFDLKDYAHQLLFSYRAAVNEVRKKEIVIEYYSILLKDSDFRSEWTSFEESIRGLKHGILDQTWTIALLSANIRDKNRRDFQAVYFELPPIPICVCGVFTFETSNELETMSVSNPSEFSGPTTAIFTNLIPLKNKSVAFFMFPKNKNSRCDSYFDELS